MYRNKNKYLHKISKVIPRWFTLVELVVVVTMLSILATVGFVSYGWYVAGARDTKRLSNAAEIKKWFSLRISSSKPINTSWTALSPNLKVSSWSTTLEGYYWAVNAKLISSLKVSGLELEDEQFGVLAYTYTYIPSMKEYQVMAMIEDDDSLAYNPIIDSAYAVVETEWYAYVEWNFDTVAHEWIPSVIPNPQAYIQSLLWTTTPTDAQTETITSRVFNYEWWAPLSSTEVTNYGTKLMFDSTSISNSFVVSKSKMDLVAWTVTAPAWTTIAWTSSSSSSSAQTASTAPTMTSWWQASISTVAWGATTGWSSVTITTADSTPTVSWDAVAWATSYRVTYVPDSTWSGITTIVSASEFTPPNDVTSWQPITIVPVATDWTQGQTSTVNVTINPAAAPWAPTAIYSNLNTNETKPVIEWTPVPWAVSYEISLDGGSTYTPVTSTSYIPPSDLSWTVSVKIKAVDDSSNKSEAWDLTINVSASYIAPPKAIGWWTTNDASPTITWDAVYWAVKYKIKIDGQVVVSDLTSTSFTPSFDLSAWWHTIEIIAINTSDVESQSTSIDVMIDFSVPSEPILVEIGTTTNATPQITWSTVALAIQYELYIDWTLQSPTPTNAAFNVSSTLAEWSHTVEVLAVSAAWKKSSRDSMNVEVVNPATWISTPQVTNENTISTTVDTTPTITWSDVWATSYEIYIDGAYVTSVNTNTYTPWSDLAVWWHTVTIVAVRSWNKSTPVTVGITVNATAVTWVCWTDNSKTLSITPTNLCSTWTAGSVTDGWVGATYTWSCVWANGWSTSYCSATHSALPVNATCWWASWWSYSAEPSASLLCTTWTAGSVTDNGTGSTYTWSCTWANGGTSANCSATHTATYINGTLTWFAWNANIWWVSMAGVVISNTSIISWYAWTNKAGWMSMTPADDGVTVAIAAEVTWARKMSGRAIIEDQWYIDFNMDNATRVNIDTNWTFHGFAWSQYYGWLSFDHWISWNEVKILE